MICDEARQLPASVPITHGGRTLIRPSYGEVLPYRIACVPPVPVPCAVSATVSSIEQSRRMQAGPTFAVMRIVGGAIGFAWA